MEVKLVNDYAKLPEKAYPSDAGFDVFTLIDFIIEPGQRVCVPLGFAVALDKNTCGWIQGKSGLANKHGITTIGNIIDANYRGECHATLVNLGDKPVKFDAYDKVAQMIIVNISDQSEFKVVEELDQTDRGEGKFGSTGK